MLTKYKTKSQSIPGPGPSSNFINTLGGIFPEVKLGYLTKRFNILFGKHVDVLKLSMGLNINLNTYARFVKVPDGKK